MHGPIIEKQQININYVKPKPKFTYKCYYLANTADTKQSTNNDDNLYFEMIMMLNQSFVDEFWKENSYEYLILLSKLKQLTIDSLKSNQIEGYQNLDIVHLKPLDDFTVLTIYLTIRKNNQYFISSSMIETSIKNNKNSLLDIRKLKVRQQINTLNNEKDIEIIPNNSSRITQMPLTTSNNLVNTSFIIDLTIDDIFTSNLLNRTSDDYLNFTMKLKTFIQYGLNKTGFNGYQDLFILNLSNGSIIVKSLLIYQYSIESPVRSIQISQALKSNNQNYLPVRLDSIIVTDPTNQG